MKNKKILIIGGTGFLGFHISQSLLKRNCEIVSVSLNKPKKIRKLNNVIYINFDISKIKNFYKLKNYSFDYVINLGGYVNHTDRHEVKEFHYIGVKNLYEHFKRKNLNLFIQVGSSLEYGKQKKPHKENIKCIPNGIYGKYKNKATNFLLGKYKKNKFPVSILRFYQVYGPKQDLNRFIPLLIKSCVDKVFLDTSTGNQKRDFLYISDAVSAFIKTIESKKSKGEIFNIGYGQSIRLKKIMSYVGSKTKFFSPRYGKVRLRKEENLDVYPDIKKAKKILKWKPKVNWKKGLDKTIKYFQIK